eukprot:6198077-Pleurochrysis_carterae.AAC.1
MRTGCSVCRDRLRTFNHISKSIGQCYVLVLPLPGFFENLKWLANAYKAYFQVLRQLKHHTFVREIGRFLCLLISRQRQRAGVVTTTSRTTTKTLTKQPRQEQQKQDACSGTLGRRLEKNSVCCSGASKHKGMQGNGHWP